MTTLLKIAVHLAIAGDVFNGVSLCCPFSHEVSCVRSETKFGQLLRGFLPTLACQAKDHSCHTKFQLLPKHLRKKE